MMIQTKDLVLTSKHEQKPFSLTAHYAPTQGQAPTIIFVHGFNAFKDWGHFEAIAHFFAQNGFTFIRFNLSHNGTTLQRPTEFVDLRAYGNDKFSTDLDDTGVLLNYLHQSDSPLAPYTDLSRLSIIGHSRGGAIAMLKAAEDKRVKALVTWASIISTKHFWTEANVQEVLEKGVVYVKNGRTKQKLPLYRAYYEDVLLNAERLDVEQNFKSLRIPTLITHGEADTSVPVSFAHTLKAWRPDAELLLIPEATHTFGGYHPYDREDLMPHAQQLCEHTAKFLKTHLS